MWSSHSQFSTDFTFQGQQFISMNRDNFTSIILELYGSLWKVLQQEHSVLFFFPSQPAVPKALLQDKILSRFPSVSCPSGPCAVWWLGSQGTGAQCPVLVWVLGLCQSRAKGQVSVLSAVRRGALYLSFTPAGHVLACLGYYLKERHHFFFWLPFKLFICHCIL